MAEADEFIFSEGQDAFERGDSQESCPHLVDGHARRLWLAGWDEARRYNARCRAETVQTAFKGVADLAVLPLA